ncbi:hypothetical protein GWI33_021074 [Rhynchophorus ferrugineus]|uniref:Uncharacterized protein n=1 Tax=Rhynchophorus ferrugineus TaxID=354439 RepID=A0A834M3K9_RHYFE|nr:hypothetical protein GWI33_021074 [Rhynchophorus ferrugineus]
MNDANHYTSSSEEDEVTFLLRLKPAPTPPVRRRKNVVTPTTTPKGWDVVIERKERDVSSPTSSSVCSSPVRRKRFSYDGRNGTRGSLVVSGDERNCRGTPVMFEPRPDVSKREEPPPIPARYRPSAPPPEVIDSYGWWNADQMATVGHFGYVNQNRLSDYYHLYQSRSGESFSPNIGKYSDLTAACSASTKI